MMSFIWIDLSSFLISLMAGVIFGLFLYQVKLTRFDTIVGQLVLKDFTLFKVVLSAALVTSFGLYLQGVIGFKPQLLISNLSLERAIIGGTIFGLGFALLGYCPATAVGAIAEGTKDGITGLFGMIAGSIVYTAVHPKIVQYFRSEGLKTLTFHEFFNMPELVAVIVFLVLVIFFEFYYLNKKN